MSYRVHPAALPSDASGLDELRGRGLPARIDLVHSRRTQQFFDFTPLREAEVTTAVRGISESVVVIGAKCSWLPAIGYTPPGMPIVVGIESGRVWLVDSTEPRVWFLDSGTPELEACLSAVAEFHRAHQGVRADRAGFLALVQCMLHADHEVAVADLAFWRSFLEALAIDNDLDFVFPRR